MDRGLGSSEMVFQEQVSNVVLSIRASRALSRSIQAGKPLATKVEDVNLTPAPPGRSPSVVF